MSLAADLFDFEVAPRSTSLFDCFGDNSRYRFAGRYWFFRRIAFDIGAIETLEIRLGVQRRISVHKNTIWTSGIDCQNRICGFYFDTFFIQSPSRRNAERDAVLGIE